MAIPISYNLRNLVVRKTTSWFTVMGVALTVAILVAALGLVAGLKRSFASTGHPLSLLVVRKGATSELVSTLSREDFQVIKVLPGIARTRNGEPMVSLEVVTVINLEGPGVQGGMNVNLRGLQPIGIEMRDQLRLVEGRMFTPGRREAVVGQAIARRYPAAGIGGTIELRRGTLEVVGIVDGGASAYNSEVYVDSNVVSADYSRTAVLSSALIHAEPGAASELIRLITDNRRLNAEVLYEREYYSRQTVAALPIQFMGGVIAIIMAAGSILSAMNTMSSSVARRAPEIGTLRTLGFSRLQILVSFLAESILLAGAGGVLGVLMVLPLRNWTTSVGSFTTYSEMSFQFYLTPSGMAAGLVAAVMIGAIGGFVPAASAARQEILVALRSRSV